jgi:eukaryotic-like serine/threonine-protein kinase
MTQVADVFSNRYEIQRGIARGGMAEVYLARDQLLDRQVAVKVLFPEYARDPSFVERFRREAQSAANLNHPNIVAIYDWGQERGTYFIVMEYVRGRHSRPAGRLRSAPRSRGRSNSPTATASSTATSSPATCC